MHDLIHAEQQQFMPRRPRRIGVGLGRDTSMLPVSSNAGEKQSRAATPMG